MTTASQYRNGLIFSSILTLGGLALLFFGINFLKEAAASKEWPTAFGKVDSIKIIREQRNSTNKRNPKHYYTVVYSYEVEGKSYQGDRYSLGDGSTASKKYRDRSEAIAAAQTNYPIGSPVDVYYNPVDPTSTVLKPGISIGTYVPLILGIIALPSGVALLVVTIRPSAG